MKRVGCGGDCVVGLTVTEASCVDGIHKICFGDEVMVKGDEERTTWFKRRAQ